MFTAAFLAIVLGLAVIACISLVTIDRKAEALSQKWLDSTRILGEMSDRISEFRLAETYRALSPDASALADAEVLAAMHRNTIADLQRQYVEIMGADVAAAPLQAFSAAWAAYLAAHDAWIAADKDAANRGPALDGSSLHRLYRIADRSIDGLADANTVATTAESRSIDRLVDLMITILVSASIVATALAGWILFRSRSRIIQPLADITQALTRLAAGDRDVDVPERNRTDEIGQMARAFDIFRANARALEQAHAATQAAQEHAQSLARHDALTGLPNRRVFSAELQTVLAQAQNNGVPSSVLIIDLDHFKQINDLQGHAVGDVVLCEVAERLRRAIRTGDTVARLGGDEFAIIARGHEHTPADMVVRLSQRVIDAVREPIALGDNRIEISASVGIASCPADGTDAEGLLRAADIAMYRAKQDGRNAFRFFEQSMDEELRAQAALEIDLKKAVAAGEIKPQYQPLVEMRDGRIYGFEVLARWEHPVRGWVGPDTFIPLAERLGLISALTTSILRQACRDAAHWGKDISLSVNISPVQLRDAALPTQLLTILNQEGFPPSRLEVEITETALVSDIETAKQILTALQAIGIKVSLDDFGTGYSSLYHLRELKFDKVKIDRSFVQSMQQNLESEKIVDAILGLARSIGLPTVAEGIENPEVQQQLADKGCEFGQGYYFGKAMTAGKAEEAMAEAHPIRAAG